MNQELFVSLSLPFIDTDVYIHVEVMYNQLIRLAHSFTQVFNMMAKALLGGSN